MGSMSLTTPYLHVVVRRPPLAHGLSVLSVVDAVHVNLQQRGSQGESTCHRVESCHLHAGTRVRPRANVHHSRLGS